MSKNWMKQIHEDIKKQIEKYERTKFTLSEDEVDIVMPKVIEFYNNHPKDQDVYRDSNGVILLIETPKMITDKNGKLVNSLEKFESQYDDNVQYLFRNCKFRIYDKTGTIGIFASQEEWAKIEGIYNKKAFIKATKLKLRYKGLGSEEKAMSLISFLKKHELEDIDELDESEYIIYYSVNITQVII